MNNINHMNKINRMKEIMDKIMKSLDNNLDNTVVKGGDEMKEVTENNNTPA